MRLQIAANWMHTVSTNGGCLKHKMPLLSQWLVGLFLGYWFNMVAQQDGTQGRGPAPSVDIKGSFLGHENTTMRRFRWYKHYYEHFNPFFFCFFFNNGTNDVKLTENYHPTLQVTSSFQPFFFFGNVFPVLLINLFFNSSNALSNQQQTIQHETTNTVGI